jgi:hypothetical protein
VIDATVIGFSNRDLDVSQPGSALDRRINVIKQVTAGKLHLRYNPKLLKEYVQHARNPRNDVIELFFQILDSDRAEFVKSNTLRRQIYALAIGKCRWPHHDQHLLAAAVDGKEPSLFVTEQRHARCCDDILMYLQIHVVLVG